MKGWENKEEHVNVTTLTICNDINKKVRDFWLYNIRDNENEWVALDWD
jgi:hypothetical protein